MIGITQTPTRGNLNCKLFGNMASSAHCLRFSDLIYHSFTIDYPSTSYSISISIYSNQNLMVNLLKIYILENSYSKSIY